MDGDELIELRSKIREQSELIDSLRAKVDSLSQRSLPDERESVVHSFTVSGSSVGLSTGYLIAGRYPGGNIGEIFIKLKTSCENEILCGCHKETSKEVVDKLTDLYAAVGGLLNQFAIAVSVGLQHGVDLQEYVTKFRAARFPPAGYTNNPKLPMCTSIVDYVFRYLEAMTNANAVNR